MFVRLTYFSLEPEKIEEMKKVYYDEVAPVIRQQPGIKDVMLLDPVQKSDDFISCSIWESESDIKAFESSEAYPSAIGKIKAAAAKAPSQKYYNID